MRRSVQSYAGLAIFPLDKCGFPSAVKDAFLSFAIRDKKAARTRCGMKKAAASSIMVAVMLLAVSVMAEAQEPKKVPRIGVLVTGSVSTHKSRDDAFRQGLRELGYTEGKNVVIEYRYAEGKLSRYPDLANEMVRLKPDVIVVASTRFTAAAKQATSTIPIVVGGAGDILGEGLVASLARPGGNITGSTSISPDVSGKRLELLKEVVPKASRVAVLWNAGPDDKEVRETEIAARAFGLKVQPLQVQDPNEFQGAYAAMRKENAHALVLIQGSFTLFHRKQLVELAAKNQLPSMCESPSWTDDGCLLSYGPDSLYQWRRAATYVDKILKGAKPADLPVEQPTKFELVINLKTAKQIGLTIPQSVLYRADKVIK
jgi:putative ABC transport system substrate-binding protein